MGSSSIVDIQDLATGYIPGASDTTLATGEASNCVIARTGTGVYTATLPPGVVGPIGVDPKQARIRVGTRTKGISINAAIGGAGNTVVTFDGWNESSFVAADCDFDFTISRVITES